MRFFAIVLVPGGNILAQVAAIKKNCSPILGSPEGLALPEGIYLGFFEFPAPALRKKFLRRFDLEAQGLFSGLPERLRFGSVRYMGKSAYLTPFGGLSGDPAENARSIGAKTGLVEYADPPILPGIGFFMGNDVTPGPVDAFSFSNMEALLLELHSPNARWDNAAWRVLRRQARRRGRPGSGAGAGSREASDTKPS